MTIKLDSIGKALRDGYEIDFENLTRKEAKAIADSMIEEAMAENLISGDTVDQEFTATVQKSYKDRTLRSRKGSGDIVLYCSLCAGEYSTGSPLECCGQDMLLCKKVVKYDHWQTTITFEPVGPILEWW